MKMHSITTRSAVLGAALALTCAAEAGSRRFAYSYETTTMAKGAVELENWLTWSNDIDEAPGLNEYRFRHELEFGVTDRLQMSVYFADWTYQDGGDDDVAGADFNEVAVEAIYNLSDPNTSSFGSALYGEVAVGSEAYGVEGKLLLQKNLGAWMFVYNIGGEVEWEDEEDNGELFQSLGVSYQFCPMWSAGFEALHEVGVPDVEEIGDSGIFVGPNVAWQYGSFSLTSAALWQLTSLEDEPDFQLRTIFSYHF